MGQCENDDTQDTVSALLKKQDDRDEEYDTVLVKRKVYYRSAMGKRCARNIDKGKIVYSARQCCMYTVYLYRSAIRSYVIYRHFQKDVSERYLKYNEEKYIKCSATRYVSEMCSLISNEQVLKLERRDYKRKQKQKKVVQYQIINQNDKRKFQFHIFKIIYFII